nr:MULTISPECIES: four helix bundle protein [Arenibacter]
MHKVENIKIWNKSMELVESVCQLVSDLPSDEKYGLNAQIEEVQFLFHRTFQKELEGIQIRNLNIF